jgi:hypothetical protein
VPLTGRRRFADETAGMIGRVSCPTRSLDLRYLKYAVQVAEAGSFRRWWSAYRYRNPPSADVVQPVRVLFVATLAFLALLQS